MRANGRVLSPKELRDLERFKKIWEQKRRELNLTQEIAGLACGWSGQSAFTQFLCGNTPLSIEAVLKLSKVLRVHPTEIMPELEDLLPEGRSVVVAGTYLTPGILALACLINELPEEQRAAIQKVVTAFSHLIKNQADPEKPVN